MRRWLCLSSAVVLVLTALPCPAQAWFGNYAPTLRVQFSNARAVLFGTILRATPPNPAGSAEGVTDVIIAKVFKSHPLVAGRKTIALRQYIPADKPGKTRFVIFCDIVQGKLIPASGFPVKAGSNLPVYIAGLLKVKEEKAAKRLRFYFNHLHHPEAAIAEDAHQEFREARDKDYCEVARGLPAAKLAAWLRDPKTPGDHLGRYASLLSYCSKDRERDAKLLRSFLADPRNPAGAGWSDILKGYLRLAPREGLRCTRDLLKDRNRPFLERHRVLAVLPFFVESRPRVLPRKDLIEAVALVLDQADLADVGIEYLRQWSCWELTPRILALKGSKEHDSRAVQRALLRFALDSPTAAAKLFVAEQRRWDPDSVREEEESIRLELQATRTK